MWKRMMCGGRGEGDMGGDMEERGGGEGGEKRDGEINSILGMMYFL